MTRGMFRCGSIQRIPLWVHWSLPAAVVLTFFLLPLWFAMVFTVVVHELGHAAMVRRFRLQVGSIELGILGGRCNYTGPALPLERAAIAWGGVLGQAAAVAMLLAAWEALPGIHTSFNEDCLTVVVGVNVVVAIVNLIPLKRLDGADAWSYFRLRFAKPRTAKLRAEKAALERELLRLQEEAPESRPRREDMN